MRRRSSQGSAPVGQVTIGRQPGKDGYQGIEGAGQVLRSARRLAGPLHAASTPGAVVAG